MNEIRNLGINYSSSSPSIGHVSQIERQSSAAGTASLNLMLDKALGAPAAQPEVNMPGQNLSLDVIMSGSLGGYLGLGSEAIASLDSGLAGSQILAARPESAAIGFNVIQIPKAEELNSSQLAAVNTIQIPHIPFPEREEGLALNTIQIPKIDMPELAEGIALNPVIPNQDSKETVAVSLPPMGLEIAETLPSELLGDFAVASNVTEAALGLVPGETLDLSRQRAIAAVEIPSNETSAENGVAFSNLPLETLAAWDAASAAPSSALAMELPDALSAKAIAARDDSFDMTRMASVPVIEGSEKKYETAWNGISETLASYNSSGSALGLAGFDGKSPLNLDILALDSTREPETLGILERDNKEVGYNSFLSEDMLGVINSSPYSSAISINVNPSSQDSALHPEKLISKIMYGYAF